MRSSRLLAASLMLPVLSGCFLMRAQRNVNELATVASVKGRVTGGLGNGSQAWIFSYPSGIRLGLASLTLRRIVDDLQRRHGFTQLVVVAHSIGGLVARDFVNQVVQRDAPQYVSLLLTISTPWNGVAAAKSGLAHSPVVVPAWIDVAQGSAYLAALSDKPLPDGLPHVLFFGYEGGNGSDGTIALESQLQADAQRRAMLVVGFPEDHSAILRSAAVSEKLNTILASR